MFVQREDTMLQSLKVLIDTIHIKPVVELYMHDNPFGSKGADQFENFLREATHLRVLSVSDCDLGPVATTKIADALISNENIKLQKLCISRCSVQAAGATALANYFNTYNTLEHIEITENKIKVDGSTALIKSLIPHSQSGALKYIKLNENDMSTEDNRNALFALLKAAQALEYLDISSSELDEED